MIDVKTLAYITMFLLLILSVVFVLVGIYTVFTKQSILKLFVKNIFKKKDEIHISGKELTELRWVITILIISAAFFLLLLNKGSGMIESLISHSKILFK